MDNWTMNHLCKWIESKYREHEFEQVFTTIYAYIMDGNQDLLNDHSWDEIYRMANA